jgi:hypothetical protein
MNAVVTRTFGNNTRTRNIDVWDPRRDGDNQDLPKTIHSIWEMKIAMADIVASMEMTDFS